MIEDERRKSRDRVCHATRHHSIFVSRLNMTAEDASLLKRQKGGQYKLLEIERCFGTKPFLRRIHSANCTHTKTACSLATQSSHRSLRRTAATAREEVLTGCSRHCSGRFDHILIQIWWCFIGLITIALPIGIVRVCPSSVALSYHPPHAPASSLHISA